MADRAAKSVRHFQLSPSVHLEVDAITSRSLDLAQSTAPQIRRTGTLIDPYALVDASQLVAWHRRLMKAR